MPAPATNEAAARVRIDALLREAGWILPDTRGQQANVQLEVGVKLTRARLSALGDDYQHINGKADYLLLDTNGKPLAVLEAKRTGSDLLAAKEQARGYAQSLRCRFVLLSNGLQHYFWDLRGGNPTQIARFPTPDSISEQTKREPADPQRLVREQVDADYIALAVEPNYKGSAWWQNEATRGAEAKERGLR